ncbi:MAG: NAD(P) transhydrogenase subunit alpha [Planctomycetales bacterium]|nr:NAD(P) transhydrogenase subunit alpha [Planctomycetales bacterium]
MKVAVVKELYPGETRVALAPANIPQLCKAKLEVVVQAGAGERAGFLDAHYLEKGAQIVPDLESAMSADVLLKVRAAGTDADDGADVFGYLRTEHTVIGACDPLGKPQAIREWATSGSTLFSLELIPRITRAQSMDILSSQATIAGYRAVLLAASELPKMFPMMMTAAGTLTAAKVLVLGAGVAGLQAIATARKLGAIVSAYDVRPACREQVESLGGKFVELDIDAASSEDKGGYAKAMDEDFYRRQRALLADVVAQCDVVITTAAIPGRQSPLLVTAEAVQRMSAGGVIVDLAAERGGNCELTKADQRTLEHGITILGPTNIVAGAANHASQMLGNNAVKFLLNMVVDGDLKIDLDDEIIRETRVVAGGEITCQRISDLLKN